MRLRWTEGVLFDNVAGRLCQVGLAINRLTWNARLLAEYEQRSIYQQHTKSDVHDSDSRFVHCVCAFMPSIERLTLF